MKSPGSNKSKKNGSRLERMRLHKYQPAVVRGSGNSTDQVFCGGRGLIAPLVSFTLPECPYAGSPRETHWMCYVHRH